MTTCRDNLELLLEYAEGQLSDDIRQQLEAHFSDCLPCEEFLETYRATPELCRKALAAKMPESVSRRLTDFLRAHTASGDSSPRE